MNATLKSDYRGYYISTRNRFECRDRENDNLKWRYRNKFTFKMPEFSNLEIGPYIADEIFVDFEKEELSRNRLYGGASFKLWKDLKGEIYYLWQSNKCGSDWKSYHILGTKLKQSF